MKKEYIVIAAAIAFIGLFIAAAAIYNNQKNSEINSAAMKQLDTMVRDYSPRMGPSDAKVTIIEFFDPACGTCKSFYPFVKQLMEENSGKVNLALRYLPLHPGSDVMFQIFEAARMQNLFWETLVRAYETQDSWVVNHTSLADRFWPLLDGIGLDMDQLATDMQSAEISRRIQQDMADAQTLQVDKTPGFFVNGKPLVNFGYRQLQKLVDDEVSAQY